MKVWKKISAMALSLCMLLGALAFTACGEKNPPDGGDETTFDYTVTVHNLDGEPVADVEFGLYKASVMKDSGVTDENGTLVFEDVEKGTYWLVCVSCPGDYQPYNFGSDEEITVGEGSTSKALTVESTTPDGSERKPYMLVITYDDNEEMVMPTATVAASATTYYEIRNLGGAHLVVESSDIEILYDGQTYTANGGKVRVPLASSTNVYDYIKFAIVNKTATEQTLTLNLVNDEGSSENPFALEFKSMEITLDKEEYVYYKWIATGDGTLTVSGISENAYIVITKYNAMTDASSQVEVERNENNLVSTTLNMEVTEGDEIIIGIGVYNGQTSGNVITYVVAFA